MNYFSDTVTCETSCIFIVLPYQIPTFCVVYIQVNTFLTPFLLSLVLLNVVSFLSCSSLLLLLLSSKQVRQAEKIAK